MKLIRNNLRQFPRTCFKNPQPGILYIEGEDYPIEVIDYGFYGVRIGVNESLFSEFQYHTKKVDLHIGDLSLSAEVRYAHNQADLHHIGLEIKPEGRSHPQTKREAEWDFIKDTKTIDDLLDDLCFKGPECMITIRQLSGLAQLIPLQIDNDVLICEVFGIDRGRLSNEQANFRFDLFQTAYAFDSAVIFQEGNFINVRKPQMLARLLGRETQRVKYAGADKDLIEGVRIYGKFFGAEIDTDLALVDYSEKGFCFLDHSMRFHGPKGMVLDRIELYRRDGQMIAGNGHIASYKYLRDYDAYGVGISFEAKDKNHRELWHNTILKARYPSLTFDYDRENDHKRIWQLFERSGYLNIKGEDSYTHTIDLTKKTWEKLADAGTQWSKRALVRNEDKIVGHIQMDQIYPGTWFIHHLAIDPKVPVTLAKELLALTIDVLGAEGGKYFINYTDSKKKWNQNYYDFVKGYHNPKHNVINTYKTYEFNLEKYQRQKNNNFVLEGFKDQSIEVRIVNAYDLKRIRRFFDLNLSELERNALALHDIELSDFNEEIIGYGLERGRTFVVAYRKNKFMGVGVVETGSIGLNIVGVLDVLFVYVDSNLSKAEKTEVQYKIIHKTTDIYSKLNKSQFLMQLDPEYTSLVESPSIKFVCETKRWISVKETFPKIQAHTNFAYGHLQTRREKIRKKIRKQYAKTHQ